MQRLVVYAALGLKSPTRRYARQTFDPDALLTCISKLIAVEERWVPTQPGHSLYIRPTMIGTKPCASLSRPTLRMHTNLTAAVAMKAGPRDPLHGRLAFG
ncbi:hypothetical protein GGX14DRAFT_609357 [Mycena pura]|uniref:Uncharacterized protein n=1 Tax=Mycena pura TaxID=153505 RepID=A0AAD6UKA9_9AGAR|nr:hypothetical protein GGX14DRAFT_609357 [Mycena pura]